MHSCKSLQCIIYFSILYSGLISAERIPCRDTSYTSIFLFLHCQIYCEILANNHTTGNIAKLSVGRSRFANFSAEMFGIEICKAVYRGDHIERKSGQVRKWPWLSH